MSAPVDRITHSLRSAAEEGRTAIVAFLTAGYPTKVRFEELLVHAARVADVVEIGVPFTDPMADGVTIQKSSRAALANGVSLEWILQSHQRMREHLSAPTLLMSYLNPLWSFGLNELAGRAVDAGVCGFIVPDLPLEESKDIGRPLVESGLGIVQLVTPVTPEDRLHQLADASSGFLYAVARTGTTGRAQSGTRAALDEAYLGRVREASSLPVCIGFGIREPDDVKQCRGLVDGVIVGSALIDAIDRGADPIALLQTLRDAGRGGAAQREEVR